MSGEEESGGEGEPGRHSEGGGGEAMEQNLRPQGPARAAPLLGETIFFFFKCFFPLCVRGSWCKNPEPQPQPSGGCRWGWGSRAWRCSEPPLCSRPGSRRSVRCVRGLRAGSVPAAWEARGQRGVPGCGFPPPERLSVSSVSARSLPPPPPARALTRVSSSPPPHFWSWGMGSAFCALRGPCRPGQGSRTPRQGSLVGLGPSGLPGSPAPSSPLLPRGGGASARVARPWDGQEPAGGGSAAQQENCPGGGAAGSGGAGHSGVGGSWGRPGLTCLSPPPLLELASFLPPLQTPPAPARSAVLIRNSRSENWSASFSSTCISTKRSGCSCPGC